MTHYAKIAAVIIRAVGCCVVVYSLISIPYNILTLLFYSYETVMASLASSVAYLIVGVALFTLGQPLGVLAVKGLPKD